MREGWTYKKMSEVFDLQMGKTPDRKTPSYFGGNNVWVSIRDLVGKEIGESNEHITDTAVTTTNIRKVKKGTVIMSFKLTVGKCAITTKDLYTNEAIMAFNLKEGYDIYPDYLYYYLSNYNWKGANKAVMGMTLNKATISQQVISYPSLSEQQSIVAELDKINELISLKKAQLSDLDSLAQSIFYDMFGDPIENEKGWEVKKLRDLCVLCQGLAINAQSKHLLTPSGELPLLRIKDMKEGTREIFVNSIECPPNCIANIDDIIYTRTGTLGLVFTNMHGVLHNNCFKINIDKTLLSKVYFMFYISGNDFRSNIIEQAKRSSQPDITHKLFLSQNIVLPPLSLQQEFAKRIELIEQQKAQISSTIKDLETLLASRMQYWFD